MQTGDFILTHGDHLASKLIRIGQRFRFRGDRRRFAKWNHAALVLDSEGNLAEALTKGVQRTHISRYAEGSYTLISTSASPEDQAQIAYFAESVLAARTRYGFVTIIGLFFTLLFGSKIVLGKIGTAICSGFVSEALTRAGAIFDRPPSYMTPADLAEHYDV